MEVGGRAQELEKGKCQTHFQKRPKVQPAEKRWDSPTLDPGKIVEHVFLEHISEHLKEKVTGKRIGFNKGKLCLINLIPFYHKMTGSVDEGRAANAT